MQISWASNRVVICDNPIFWMKFDVPRPGYPLYAGAGVPQIPRFATNRVSAAVMGPGLPMITSDVSAKLPSTVQNAVGVNEGVLLVESPQDQSTCSHLQNSNMIAATDIQGGRCHFHEQWEDSHSWVVLDRNITLAESGRHYMAWWIQGNTTGKYWASVSDWRMIENFAAGTVQDAGEGAQTSEAFYEKTTDDEVFPPFYSCAANSQSESSQGTNDNGFNMGGNSKMVNVSILILVLILCFGAVAGCALVIFKLNYEGARAVPEGVEVDLENKFPNVFVPNPMLTPTEELQGSQVVSADSL